MKTTFKTKIKHKPGTEIEVHGQYFTFDAAGFGTLTTDHPGVIDRLRSIPEGYVELAQEQAPARAPVAPVTQPAPQPEAATKAEEPAVDDLGPEQGESAPEDGEPTQASSDASPEGSGYVLRGPGGQTIDLGAMDDAALRAFVVEQGLKVNGRAKGDTLRKAIVATLTKGNETLEDQQHAK